MAPPSDPATKITSLLSSLPHDIFLDPSTSKSQAIVAPLSQIACDMFDQFDHDLVEVFMKKSPRIVFGGHSQSPWEFLTLWHIRHVPERKEFARKCWDYLTSQPPNPMRRRMGQSLLSSLATWFPNDFAHALMHEEAVSKVGLRGFLLCLTLGLEGQESSRPSHPVDKDAFWKQWRATVHPEEVMDLLSVIEDISGPSPPPSYTSWVIEGVNDLIQNVPLGWWCRWEQAWSVHPEAGRRFIARHFPHYPAQATRALLLKKVSPLSDFKTESKFRKL